MTTVGTITLVGNVEVIWYDHYGDPNPVNPDGSFDPLESANDLGFQVRDIQDCSQFVQSW